ncbi:MAG: hypothetical protein AAF244_02725, partial [Pseudomonadota bacterium]
GFVKYKKIDGEYIENDSVILASRVEEFFEELVSGSIELPDGFKENVEAEYQLEISSRKLRSGEALKKDKKDEIYGQVETYYKMRLVREKDPEFFKRLVEVLKEARECYAGPVLNSNRATDNAWIETRMFWTHLTEDKWEYIKGENPAFDYALAAGDDADGVHYFEMDWKLIHDANASHAPLFAFMAASYLLDTQEKGQELDSNIISQLEDMAGYLDAKSAEALARPEGFIHYRL